MSQILLLVLRGSMAAMLLTLAALARAEEVGCTSTTFNLFSPNDKVCVMAFNDPDIDGVTCHISQAKTGGWKGAVGVAEDPISSAPLRCRQTWTGKRVCFPRAPH
jgi:CreA protein